MGVYTSSLSFCYFLFTLACHIHWLTHILLLPYTLHTPPLIIYMSVNKHCVIVHGYARAASCSFSFIGPAGSWNNPVTHSCGITQSIPMLHHLHSKATMAALVAFGRPPFAKGKLWHEYFTLFPYLHTAIPYQAAFFGDYTTKHLALFLFRE